MKVIVGERGETLQEKNIRHIKEMELDIEGWKNELDYSKKVANKMYEDYCLMMIAICENTISSLKRFAGEHFV